ncbi:MAG: hypothetical protein DMF87_12630 [Acidobacteria bacterium]|nr:MAG: hypothetical protein DMF87_12630 [Acidobacteriota bacterium]
MMFGTQGFRAAWAIDQHFKNLTVTTASLSLLINYPHFLISYKLAYSRGRAFVTAHWWQLLVVPAALIATFAFAYAYYSTPVSQLPIFSMLSSDLRGLGTNAQAFSGPRLGDLLFGLTFNVMIFTVGWHYTKQVFGCMMVYAYFDKYRFTPFQRTLTKYALLSIWWLNFVTANVSGAQNNFSQFKYYAFDLPDILVPLTTFLVYAGFVLVVYEVFWKNYRERGQAPGVNMVVPFLALYVWWLPITRQYEFYFLLTPFFHSLQYLAFVYKMEDTRLRGLRNPEIRGTILAFSIVVAGWLAFEFVPNEIDTALGTFNSWQMFFFFTAAMLFINIHHYFIDNVLWRFKDPEIQKYLLA